VELGWGLGFIWVYLWFSIGLSLVLRVRVDIWFSIGLVLVCSIRGLHIGLSLVLNRFTIGLIFNVFNVFNGSLNNFGVLVLFGFIWVYLGFIWFYIWFTIGLILVCSTGGLYIGFKLVFLWLSIGLLLV